jgi:hypothetical protein
MIECKGRGKGGKEEGQEGGKEKLEISRMVEGGKREKVPDLNLSVREIRKGNR